MKLSSRKKEILTLLAQGLTDKEIALKLQISKRTVQTHISNILNGLNARNRVHAVALYMMAHPRWKMK
ncbi:MAG: LuxR C-terminal-related transcriptional regulator [Muribaculaceae bacterium]|nr:LuxR C-terminal-related transcriptional regulator [Muribaculaceae bacterium]